MELTTTSPEQKAAAPRDEAEPPLQVPPFVCATVLHNRLLDETASDLPAALIPDLATLCPSGLMSTASRLRTSAKVPRKKKRAAS
jgi:hypothetical protein